MQSAAIRAIEVTVQRGPKSKPLPNYQKNRTKTYISLPMKIHLFVKLEYQSYTIILWVGIKYSAHDLLCDVINYA